MRNSTIYITKFVLYFLDEIYFFNCNFKGRKKLGKIMNKSVKLEVNPHFLRNVSQGISHSMLLTFCFCKELKNKYSILWAEHLRLLLELQYSTYKLGITKSVIVVVISHLWCCWLWLSAVASYRTGFVHSVHTEYTCTQWWPSEYLKS